MVVGGKQVMWTWTNELMNGRAVGETRQLYNNFRGGSFEKWWRVIKKIEQKKVEVKTRAHTRGEP